MLKADNEQPEQTLFVSARVRTIFWIVVLSAMTLGCPGIAINAYVHADGDWGEPLPDSPSGRFSDVDLTMGAAVAVFSVLTLLLAGSLALNIVVLRQIDRAAGSDRPAAAPSRTNG